MKIQILDPKQFEFVDAQLSEIIWHSFSLDPRILQMSHERFDKIDYLNKKYNFFINANSNVLEIAANNHITSYMIAAKYKSSGIVLDISKEALSQGRALAKQTFGDQILMSVKSIAGDFHNLPFESGSFDFIFVSHAIHHTNRPETLIREMLRVLKPEGLLLITEEPVKREMSIYQFNVNRKESFTPFETHLYESGNLGLIAYPSSPHGSRPEELFGVIENYKIPLQDLRNLFKESCSIIEEWATPSEDWNLEQSFDRHLLNQIIKIHDEKELRHDIEVNLRKNLEIANNLFTDINQLMGMTKVNINAAVDIVMKQIDDAKKLAYKIDAESVFTVDHLNLFGGMYGCLLRRISHKYQNSPKRIIKASDILDVHQDFLESEHTLVDLNVKELPDIQINTAHNLLGTYPADDWSIYRDPYKIQSCVNKKALMKVNFKTVQKKGVLLCRYYGVFEKDPYKVVIKIGEIQIGSHTICANETRLFKAYLNQLDGPLIFDLQTLNGQPLSINPENRILVGILQYYSFKT